MVLYDIVIMFDVSRKSCIVEVVCYVGGCIVFPCWFTSS